MNAVEKLICAGWLLLLCLLCFLPEWTEGRVTPRMFSFSGRNIFSEPSKSIPGPEKNYTGIRVQPNSLLLAYYHEQTVAVVEVSPTRELYNCELLEVRTKADKMVALNSLKPVIPTQMKISFTDMVDLMSQCEKLDSPLGGRQGKSEKAQNGNLPKPGQFFSLFSGVFPGTKWCGTGDIASSYHDLGTEKELDKCCRTHDFCPVKVAGFKTQYNLTNYAIYTRSHCVCDEIFYNCLKHNDSYSSSILGGLYFNVTPLTCVEDVLQPEGTTKKRFAIKNKRF